MSGSTQMLELRLDSAALIRFAQDQQLNRNRDEDLGYLQHAWLQALFADLAPKPFRFVDGPQPRLLAYSSHSGEVLLEQAQSFASPLALGVTRIEDLRHAKPLPTAWREGRRLGFELLATPVSRKQGREKDYYLHYLERIGEAVEPLSRQQIYLDWLTQQFGGAATLSAAEVAGFRLISQFRKGEKRDGGRSGRRLIRPQVLFKGQLTINQGEVFAQLLARGIGRHRAFGYGMLLLRPT